MPQDIDLHIPFPSAISPDVDAAREHNLAWVEAYNLVSEDAARRRYLSWDVPGLMARWVPEATGPDLDLISDAFAVGILLDDQFDGRLDEDLDRAAEVIVALCRVMESRNRPISSPIPLIAAFADAWTRLIHGMSDEWCAHTRLAVRASFEAYVSEARNRRDDVILTTEQFFALRRQSGSVRPMLRLTERALHLDIPSALRTSRLVCDMEELTVDVLDTINDLYSLEQETERGDVHNLIAVMVRQRGCSVARAVSEARGLIHTWIDEFVGLAAGLPELYDALDLTARQRQDAERLIGGMRSAMRGSFDWSRASARYAVAALVPAGEPAYPEDLTSARGGDDR